MADHKCSDLTVHRPLWRIPDPGDVVLYRPKCFERVEPAEVVEVLGMTAADEDRNDLNVWQTSGGLDDLGKRVKIPPERRVRWPWPNPNVRVRLKDGREVVTRQIRFEGSPGWCWPLTGN
jgi:hypothetical protein